MLKRDNFHDEVIRIWRKLTGINLCWRIANVSLLNNIIEGAFD